MNESFRGGSPVVSSREAMYAYAGTAAHPTLFPIAKHLPTRSLPPHSICIGIPSYLSFLLSIHITVFKQHYCKDSKIMGRLSHESSRSSIDTTSNGEGLPLYSDVTVTSPGELSVPSEKATADEVREFLMQLLIKNRGLHQDHARRVASKWTLGTGRELISYPPRLYAEIFGLEDAWMVYKEAKVFICTEKKKGRPSGFCK